MHKDFLTAIQNNEPPQSVYDRLCNIEDRTHEEILKSYRRDKKVTEHIYCALQEPVGSVPYEWAQAYRRQAELEEAQKDEEVLRAEDHRRRLEAEYLKLKQKEIEEMRKHYHSTK